LEREGTRLLCFKSFSGPKPKFGVFVCLSEKALAFVIRHNDSWNNCPFFILEFAIVTTVASPESDITLPLLGMTLLRDITVRNISMGGDLQACVKSENCVHPVNLPLPKANLPLSVMIRHFDQI
jgi:hypothetical protein